MGDASARQSLLPAIPQPGFGHIVFRLNKEMLFQVLVKVRAVQPASHQKMILHRQPRALAIPRAQRRKDLGVVGHALA